MPAERSLDNTVRRRPAPPPDFACSQARCGQDAVRVHVVGELDCATAAEPRRTLRDSQSSAPLVVLDLRELAFMDSAGVHEIVRASMQACELGQRLVVLRGQPNVDRVSTLTGTGDDVEIRDAATFPALAALGGGPTRSDRMQPPGLHLAQARQGPQQRRRSETQDLESAGPLADELAPRRNRSSG